MGLEAWQKLQPTIDRLAQSDFSRLTPQEQVVWLVWGYPAAVNDGGHASFFYNSYGEAAHETVDALAEIGATQYARILDRAIDLFAGRNVPRDIDRRNDALARLPESADDEMGDLDDEFFALGDDQLMELLSVYWESFGSIEVHQ